MGERGGSITRSGLMPAFKLPPMMHGGARRGCCVNTSLGLYGSVGVIVADVDRDAGRLLLGSG